MSELNPAQLEAVTHGDGPMLIFAGAGSGKTFCTTARVRSLIERGVPPSRICSVTFTNKAAGELRDRLATMVGAAHAKALWTGTFHSICARLLRAHPEGSGRTASFVIYDEDDTKHVIRPILDEAEALAEKRGIKLADGALKPDKVLDEIAKEKSKGLMPDDVFAALANAHASDVTGDAAEERLDALAAANRMRSDDGERIFFEVWRDYEERMQMLDAFDFEDLMLHGMRLVERQDEVGERLRAKFLHVLVDEYQDTNRTQFRLIRALATSRNLCAVGDPRQCLVAGTMIATPDGSVPIESIKPGDIVRVSGSGETHTTAVVTDVFRGKARYDGLVEIVTKAGRRLTCTGEHRVFTSRAGYQDRPYLALGVNGMVYVRWNRLATINGRAFDSLERAREFLALEFGYTQQECAECVSHFDCRNYVAVRAETLVWQERVPVLWDERRQQSDEVETCKSVEPPRPDRAYEEIDVYDLHIPGAYNYYANEILVHNSIYGWRGADISIIRGFKKHFPDARVVQLAQNYRSTKHIVAVANAIAPLGDDSGCEPMVTDNDEGEKVSVVCVRDERDEGQLVGDEIAKLVRRGEPLSSFAVLYRVHSQSRAIENELRTMDLRYKVVGGLKFFHRAEIKNAVACLRLAMRPDSDIDLLRTIDAPPCGVGAATMKVVQRVAREKKIGLVAALADVAKLPETKHKAREAVTALHARLADVRACIVDKPIDEVVRASLVASGYKLWLTRQMTEQIAGGNKKKAEDAENRLANLAELVTDAARWRLRREKEDEKTTLTAYLERVALLSSDDETRSEESVTLTTVHAAKGKEWSHVFVVGFEEDFFPAFPNNKTPDEITEEARVAYVALSRAKKRMWITRASVRWHQGQEKRNPPSRYIQHLPKESIALRGHT